MNKKQTHKTKHTKPNKFVKSWKLFRRKHIFYTLEYFFKQTDYTFQIKNYVQSK